MTKRKILYGYQIRGGALEIIPEEQRVVQMLFALYSAGASYQDISDALNRQGVPYSSEIPLWNKHKIKRMLENARYTGKDGYPVMIAETDFQAVQDKISETEMPQCSHLRYTLLQSCQRPPNADA